VTPRPAWKVLHDRAEAESGRATARVAEARAQQIELEKRLERLDAMREDYLKRLQDCNRGTHLIAQAMTLRRFVSQIELLRQRAAAEVEGARAVVAAARQALAAAERERMKYESLVERNAQAIAHATQVQEQRAMDAQALVRFNFRG
jgi:flagellar export protein FliJ